MPEPIEQKISVTGGEEARQQFDGVADAGRRMGDATQDAGEKSQAAGGQMASLDSMLTNLRASAISMISGFLGFEAVIGAFREFKEILEQIQQLQAEMADKAVTLSEAASAFQAQTKMPEAESIELVSRLAQRGGISYGAAESLGRTVDIVLGDRGGIRANQPLAETLAPFVGSAALDSGSVEQLLNFLKSNNKLGSPEEAQAAIAQFAAVAQGSVSPNVGAFAMQLNRTAAAAAGAGISFEDQLQLGAQAIGANPASSEQAAEATKTLLTLASAPSPGLSRILADRAKAAGIDPRSMTRAQATDLLRDYLGGIDTKAEEDQLFKAVAPEQALRVLQAFGPVNVAQQAEAAGAYEGVGAPQFASDVDQYRTTVRYRRAAGTAQSDYLAAQRGLEVFDYQEARKRAEERVNRLRTERTGRQQFVDFVQRDEAVIEEEMFNRLYAQVDKFRDMGLDVSEADAALDALSAKDPFGKPVPRSARGAFMASPLFGYPDEKLEKLAGAVGRLQRTAGTTIVNNIGTVYNDVEPGRIPEEGPDLNE